ncbi:hypothetical protein EXN66_Car001004 [Channa argus]|uniref:Uncharacterized protein n=1 Tax=Channa argus TaxID=215402 RepID=A0A6G1QYQ5_CHAAH|nr:hypothetical protein EXN66_Car001004 [Channa argus]
MKGFYFERVFPVCEGVCLCVSPLCMLREKNSGKVCGHSSEADYMTSCSCVRYHDNDCCPLPAC